MNCGEYSKTLQQTDSRLIGRWFDEMQLYVAPTCNMLCNFCSKGNDCICNGNNPGCWSRTMTPRQAVNWAVSSTTKDKRIRAVRISGPGEPLCNNQTFEVLRRLKDRLEGYIFNISTNGLLLEEKADELAELGTATVDISMSAVNDNTISRLYSKLILDGNIVADPVEVASVMKKRQMNGLEKCMKKGLYIRINTVFFPGINEDDILEIARIGKYYGATSMCLISCSPGGKLTRIMPPSYEYLFAIQHKVNKIMPEVSIKLFNN